MTSLNSILENRALIRTRIGPPDVYPQDPKQKEDELTSVNVKQGFINQTPYFCDSGETGSAQHYPIDITKLNRSFNDIVRQKQINNTFNDTVKKRPALTKDNFWLVPVAKNRNHLQQWIKELRGGKSLNYLGRRVPIFSKKEEVFQTLAENQITIVRATWYIKMTAQYGVLQAEAKNKKNRNNVDHNPEWTASLCRFMRDQLSRLLDDPSLNNSGTSVIPQQSMEETEKHFEYISKLAHHLYSEGMLDRHDFLNWVVETMEKIRLLGTHALSYVMPMVMKYIQDIIKNQLLSRRLAFVTSRLLNWMLNESTWGGGNSSLSSSINNKSSNAIESPSAPMSVGPPSVSGQQSQKQLSAPPTSSQGAKPSSPQKNGQQNSIAKPRTLPTNFPKSLEDIAHGLICIIQCITMECPGALVWYQPDDPKTPGSPLDYLPVAPSLLPLPSTTKIESLRDNNDNLTRARLREMEADVIQRSYAAEMRWSSDKCQESATGQTITRVLNTLEALDKQQNFDRTEPIDFIYNKIFVHNNSKDGSGNDQTSQAGEEAVIWLLCEWAITAQRLGEHRAGVVAKLLDKRQEKIAHEREQAAMMSSKLFNSSGTATSSSNPGSVGTPLLSPPPQLLVEGMEPPQNDTRASVQPPTQQNLVVNNNPHMFQAILFNFLDTQAPLLDNPSDMKELQSFKNLVVLFSELIQHDVFSHDEYVSALISRGDITPGQISPLPIYIPTSGPSSNTTTIGYTNHSVGVMSVASVGPTSVGPSSNKPLDMLLKSDADDELPSSVRSIDPKNDSDLVLFSPVNNSDILMSPDGRNMAERHFTDVIKEIPDNSKDKNGGLGLGMQMKRPTGPIWGYRQPRHVQFLMHFPISFEDDESIHESNQRLMVLYGAGRQRNEVKKAVKKITKYVCKLVQKRSITSPAENSFCIPSTKVPSVGGSKKSKNRTTNDLSLSSSSNSQSPDMLLKRFRCLSYFDQHYITTQASKAILTSFSDYVSERSQNLPLMNSITLVLNLMEEALNFGGIVQLAVQISSVLTSLETEISRRHPTFAGCYTKDLALNIVSVLRHYQSYLTLDIDLTRQAFDAMHSFIKQSNITNPGHCTSPDRCVLIFLYDLFTSFRSKYLLLESQVQKFSSFASVIRQTLCQSKIPAKSNCKYDNTFLIEYIENPNSMHPLIVARQNCILMREATYKYSFVCSVIITMCTGQNNPESLSSIATLCAEMNAQCNDLSSEWLGVLKALCCSSTTANSANFTDVLIHVEQAVDDNIHDPLALFTAILIARNCLSMENFIKHVAIPSLLAACPSRPGLNVSEAETGARLTCHILLQLFKTPLHPSQINNSSETSGNEQRPPFYIPEASDRHLLAASQRNIVVGAVLAVLKAIVKLGDASFGGGRSSSPAEKENSVSSFFLPIRQTMDDDDFGLGGPLRSTMSSGDSMDTPSLSDFAKNAVRVICSQQWVRERCLKIIEWDLLMDKELTQGQRQNLIQLICCPEEELQRLSETPHNQRSYVLQVLHRMSRWTLRQTLLELQIMLKQAGEDQTLSEDIAKAVIEVFKEQNTEPTKDRKSPITGIELDRSNVWLMPPLISELSSEVQAKVLHEASVILETSQHWSRTKPDRDRNSGRNPASLLSQQPFLTLILTCLKVQAEQRDSLLESLQSQILMFHSEWQSGRQQQQRDGSNSQDSTMTQSMVQEALQLRLSLMGGMFDTVQTSLRWINSVVMLLTQLISSGMVDIEVNAKLFNIVFDMIAVLLHGTLGGDSPNSGEGRKKNEYLLIVKRIGKEISDGKTASLKILRRLLTVPRKETFVIACEASASSGSERQGLQVASKQKITPWDIIEGLKISAPLSLPWYGAAKTERKELPYLIQQRLMMFHSHEEWQVPLEEYLKPPELPPEEEEKPPTPKVNKRKTQQSTSNLKSPSAAPYGPKDALHPPAKKQRVNSKIKQRPSKKSQELSSPYPSRAMSNMPGIYNTNMVQGGIGMQASQSIRSSVPGYGTNQHQSGYNVFAPPQPPLHPGVSSNQPFNISHPGMQHKGNSSIKRDLANFIINKSGQQQQRYPRPTNPIHTQNVYNMHNAQQSTENSRIAIRSMIRGRTNMTGMQNDIGQQLSYRARQSTQMGPPMSTLRSINNPAQQSQIGGYGNYVNTQGGGMNQMHMMRGAPSYNSYQGGGGSTQQQGYHQSMPNQSYINQQQNTGMNQGYSMSNMGQMQGGGGMNQQSSYNMGGGMQIQNQSMMGGGQQPPQYGGMMAQQGQGRTMNRINQHQMNAGSQGMGGMQQIQGMGGGQNSINQSMGRPMQMVNQGLNSEHVPQQQETAQLVKMLRGKNTNNRWYV
ncbi:mediator of RNA polymerase II transcription subunit 12-like isoform X1 [Styela clava]